MESIERFGNKIIPVNDGELASGLYGEGRMAEPAEIISWLNRFFGESEQLKGKEVLITAGPTHEAIDPVRFIGNASSGKMGIALAKEIRNRGGTVTLVTGPTQEKIPKGINTINVTSASQMFDACIGNFAKMDWAIMSAAVADYTPVHPVSEKIKKTNDHFTIDLKKTNDILKTLGERKTAAQCLVGFALETDNMVGHATKKLREKNLDIIVANELSVKSNVFGAVRTNIAIIDRNGGIKTYVGKTKGSLAKIILDKVLSFNI